jgi:hypothetical protein
MSGPQPSKGEDQQPVSERIKAAVRDLDRAHRLTKYLLNNVAKLARESERHPGHSRLWIDQVRQDAIEESVQLATSQARLYFRTISEIHRAAGEHLAPRDP